MKTQYAAFDGNAIWGVGASHSEAIADARTQWDTTRPDELEQFVSELDTLPMSEVLAKLVSERGGDVAFFRDNGVLRSTRLED